MDASALVWFRLSKGSIMKNEIHPTYYPEAQVICACGNTWTTGSTREEIRTDVCYKCHPFFTGEQRIVDTEGQVDRFYKKLQARQDFISEQEAREAERVSPERPIEELELSKRATDILASAEITKVGDVLTTLEKSKNLRQRGQIHHRFSSVLCRDPGPFAWPGSRGSPPVY